MNFQQLQQQRLSRLSSRLERALESNRDAPLPMQVEGRLMRMVGLTLEASGIRTPIGSRCLIDNAHGGKIEAEVVGFSGDRVYLMPTGNTQGISPDSRVVPTGKYYTAPVGAALLGRVIDGAGEPLDGKGPLQTSDSYPLAGYFINPMERAPIRQQLDVGVRAINSMLAVGQGQRMGLFAGSGVGKSVLLGMMTKYTTADVIVVGLIGERGREVKEFIDEILGEEGLKRSVVVAAPADTTPVMRLHGASMATAIAEYYRDQGKNVLLLMDSLTRYAMAQRELALSIGEPPATKGYPASVFAKIPQLVERAGNGREGGGSMTAFYTVLTEGDDQQDPVADSARAILDGHVVLNRRLVEMGHFPAIDIEASISRVMPAVTTTQHQQQARAIKRIYSLYEKSRDLISVGAYSSGSDKQIDEAIRLQPHIATFLQQDMQQKVTLADSIKQMQQLVQA
ncbi:flagellar protein export ATPase FliI [Ectothiorhodospiraceae bacterium BW-2]|nr:flagellar protein export ATPase FliI [Ectothiorhodospiraceae bacterium BW-2]